MSSDPTAVVFILWLTVVPFSYSRLGAYCSSSLGPVSRLRIDRPQAREGGV